MKAAVRNVIVKYARTRKSSTGRLLVIPCSQTAYERDMRNRYDPQGAVKVAKKIIYDSREQAEACARELHEKFGGELMSAYPCQRSRHDHHHLTSH